jgi:hypothetical protein
MLEIHLLFRKINRKIDNPEQLNFVKTGTKLLIKS